MEFAFDLAKDEANRFKHGVPLAFGARVFVHDDHIVLHRIDRSMARIDTRRSGWWRQAVYRDPRLAREDSQVYLGATE